MQKKVFFREPQLQRKSLGLGCHNLDDCPPSATNKSYPVFKLTPIYKLASFQRKTQPAPRDWPGTATGPADKSTRGPPHRKSNLKAQNQNPQAQITISLRCVWIYSTQIDHNSTKVSVLKEHKESKHESVVCKCNLHRYKATANGSLNGHVKALHEEFQYFRSQCEYETLPVGLTYSYDQCTRIARTKPTLRQHQHS